jgi:hypothetical protein
LSVIDIKDIRFDYEKVSLRYGNNVAAVVGLGKRSVKLDLKNKTITFGLELKKRSLLFNIEMNLSK